MFILDTTTKSLLAVLASSVTTNQPEFTVAYADNTGSAFTEGSTDGTFNGTSDVTLVSAPANSTRRVVKSLFIYNKDTVSHTFTIKYDNNGTQRHTHKFTLGSGETWNLDTNTVSSTSSAVTTGTYLPVQYLVVGGGGGGGSGTPPYGTYAPSNTLKPGLLGGGGGAGGFVEGLISLELGRAYPLKVGAGGAAGVWNYSGAQNTINTASNTSGKNGEDSVLGTGNLPIIAFGGGGGAGSYWNSYRTTYPGSVSDTQLIYNEVSVSKGGSTGAGFLPDIVSPATTEPTAFAYLVDSIQHQGPFGGFGNRGHLAGPKNTGTPTYAPSGAANAFPSGYSFVIGGGGGAGSAGNILYGGGGKDSTITGTPVTYAGGGGGGDSDYSPIGGGYVPSSPGWNPSNIWTANRPGSGGPGGGGNGLLMYRNAFSPGSSSTPSNTSGFNATSGTANTGGGGGGGGGGVSADANIFPSPGTFYSLAGDGGSGVIIIRIPNTFTATFSSGVTSSLSTSVAGFKIYSVTNGSGTVTFT
jgi:hypothetical protein